MRNKFFLYLLAVFTAAIYFLAGNKQCMIYFMKNWDNDKRPEMLKHDISLYGNLYHLCYLSNYRFENAGDYLAVEKNGNKKSEGNLWIIGDSFLAKMYGDHVSSNLFQTDVKHFFWFGITEQPFSLPAFQPDKKNILLLEMNEYYVRNRFTSKNTTNEICSCYRFGQSSKPVLPEGGSIMSWRIVPTTIEQNLETILFGYKFLEGVKGAKADFSFNAFGRSDPQVFVSPTQNRLFQAPTVDTTQIQSSFKYISDAEIDIIVKNMNLVAAHYREMGFSDVVICIIPDAASICSPPGYHYNQLIPRIQANENLKVDLLDVYTPIIESGDPCSLYWKSDSHWNVNGYMIWENKFNAYLKSYYAGNDR